MFSSGDEYYEAKKGSSVTESFCSYRAVREGDNQYEEVYYYFQLTVGETEP